MLTDELMPVYDVSDSVATVVDADLATTWRTLMAVDLVEVGRKHPLVAVLGGLRILPDIVNRLLHGELPARGPTRLRLDDLTKLPLAEGGWVLLGRRDQHEIALGLIGKFWRPRIEFADVASRHEFLDFATPGFAKTILSLSMRPYGSGRTLLTATMRTATTDEHARRWFRRYWTIGVCSGAHVLVHNLLAFTRGLAEMEAEHAC